LNDRQRALLTKARTKVSGCETLIEMRLYDDAVLRAAEAMRCAAEAFLAGEDSRSRRSPAILLAFKRRFVQTRKVGADFHNYLVEAEKDRRDIEQETDFSASSELAEKHVHHAEAFVEFALINLSGKPAAAARKRRR
jgi:uncharacterized protein (UPF0332 family)